MLSRIVLLEAGLGLLAVGLAAIVGIPLREQLRITPGAVWAGVLTVPPLLAGLFVVSRSAWPPARRLLEEVRALIRPLVRTATTAELGMLALAAGVGEELLFRGVMQTGLTAVAGPWGAVLVTSLVFGLAHALTRLYAVLAFLVSVYLGWLLLMTGSLVAPMLTHALYDWVALVYLVRSAGPLAVDENDGTFS